MSSIGVSIPYFYTCYKAFILSKTSKNQSGFNPKIHIVSPFKKTYAGSGTIASIIFIDLLFIPGLPTFLEKNL